MAAILTIHVENQLHERVRTIVEPPGEPFLRFCRKAAGFGVRYTDFIWAYADSTLNFFQLAAWLEDFPEALLRGDFGEDECRSALRVLKAAREAHDLDGYLLFEG